MKQVGEKISVAENKQVPPCLWKMSRRHILTRNLERQPLSAKWKNAHFPQSPRELLIQLRVIMCQRGTDPVSLLLLEWTFRQKWPKSGISINYHFKAISDSIFGIYKKFANLKAHKLELPGLGLRTTGIPGTKFQEPIFMGDW